MLNKLTEENLFFLLEKNAEIKSTIFTGKIVEITQIKSIIISNTIIVKFILLNNEKKLYEIEYKGNKNEENNYNNIKIGQLFLINDYKIFEFQDKLPVIEIQDNSFIYFSDQNLYFSNKIKINNLSVLQFYFLDYNKNNNIYNKILVNEEINNINKDEMNIIIDNEKRKNSEYSPIN